MRMPGRISLGMTLPGGWIFSVSIIATGRTGAPVASATRARPPGLPRYRRPSGERVPSG